MKHNAWSYSNRGCSCEVCLDAHRRKIAEMRARRRAARVLVGGRLVTQDPAASHGTSSTYNNYACRCAHCTAAHNEHIRRGRATRQSVGDS